MVYALPLLALILPGLVLYMVNRRLGSRLASWIAAALPAGYGLWLLAQVSGAAHDDAQAINRILLAAFVLFPAAGSALLGGLLGRAARRRTGLS